LTCLWGALCFLINFVNLDIRKQFWIWYGDKPSHVCVAHAWSLVFGMQYDTKHFYTKPEKNQPNLHFHKYETSFYHIIIRIKCTGGWFCNLSGMVIQVHEFWNSLLALRTRVATHRKCGYRCPRWQEKSLMFLHLQDVI
jgi:hypothetical protein